MVAYRIEIYDPDGVRGQEWHIRERFTDKREAEFRYDELMEHMTLGKARLTKVYEKIEVLKTGPEYRKYHYDRITGKKVFE